ncbi:MAG: hypothetical protein Q4D62_07470 [Planctomycetia bacterium]|nr:hypothetical protein [Planctomycetia bacterium]
MSEYIDVMNVLSIHAGLVHLWVGNMMSAKTALRIWEHWKRLGCPAYIQFDNGTVFSGPPKPNGLGRVVRMCLELGTSVVFSILRETEPQARVERFNGPWERTLGNRFEFQTWNGGTKV